MATGIFITNHGAVLALIAERSQITAREIASELGVTERSVLRIISDLEAGGYIQRSRAGRVNRYHVNLDMPLRRPDYRATHVGKMLTSLARPKGEKEGGGLA